MSSSEDFADEALTLVVEAGGSWWLALLDTAPPDDLATVSVIADIPPVEIARDALSWVVASRQANPVDALTLDTTALTADVVPLAWCLFDDAALTLPRIAGRLADIRVTPGSTVTVPAATVTIRYPASVASTL